MKKPSASMEKKLRGDIRAALPDLTDEQITEALLAVQGEAERAMASGVRGPALAKRIESASGALVHLLQGGLELAGVKAFSEKGVPLAQLQAFHAKLRELIVGPHAGKELDAEAKQRLEREAEFAYRQVADVLETDEGRALAKDFALAHPLVEAHRAHARETPFPDFARTLFAARKHVPPAALVDAVNAAGFARVRELVQAVQDRKLEGLEAVQLAGRPDVLAKTPLAVLVNHAARAKKDGVKFGDFLDLAPHLDAYEELARHAKPSDVHAAFKANGGAALAFAARAPDDAKPALVKLFRETTGFDAGAARALHAKLDDAYGADPRNAHVAGVLAARLNAKEVKQTLAEPGRLARVRDPEKFLAGQPNTLRAHWNTLFGKRE